MKQIKYISLCLTLLCLMCIACDPDNRADEITGGYSGAFIDKITGDTVPTEYFGAKVKLLDLTCGSVAQPITFKALPDGSYQNTKVYPSRYKIWADGPFLSIDTIYGDIKKQKDMNLRVIPNMRLWIKDVQVQYGISVTLTIGYSVNDLGSNTQEVGLVYSESRYPGFLNAFDEGGAGVTIKKLQKVTDPEGEYTVTIYLNENQSYYIRALGRTASAGDYWNYSKPVNVTSGGLDISQLPVAANQGLTSATSAVIHWAFPPIVDKIKISYTDNDGQAIEDYMSPKSYSYVANLTPNKKTSVTVNLISKGVVGPDNVIEIKTKARNESYVPMLANLPAGIPFFYDINVKKSISMPYANMLGPMTNHLDWVNNASNHQFIDWWGTWLNNPQYLPTSEYMEMMETMTIYGDVKTLVDLLPFTNLKKLTIAAGGPRFATDLVIDANVDLAVLKKLKKLTEIVIGKNVPLTPEQFDKAGIKNVNIIKE